MARVRKRHVQQLFVYLDKNNQRRGIDKHRRPGRPVPKGQRPSERHKKRPALLGSEPCHITMRAVTGVKLRKRHIYQAIRKAMVTSFHRTSFRIVHASIQYKDGSWQNCPIQTAVDAGLFAPRIIEPEIDPKLRDFQIPK